MANKFSQGTVVGAGTVIAGVDADNPPVTVSSGSSSATSLAPKWLVVGAPNDPDAAGAASGSVYLFDANNLSAQPTKILSPDPETYDEFGKEVSALGDTFVVGVWGDDDDGSFSGSAYVYDANDLSSPTKLTAFDGSGMDIFGWSNTITTSQIVIGAPKETNEKGSIYVYDRNDLTAQATKLMAPDAENGDQLSWSVDATDSLIVAGARYDDNTGAHSRNGSAYVWNANDLGAQPTKLTAFDESDAEYFGEAISVSDNHVVVGAWAEDPTNPANGAVVNNAGAVYVFNTSDLSAQPTKLTPLDAGSALPNEYFGRAVAATNDWIVVGAQGNNTGNLRRGVIYVYDANDLSAEPTVVQPPGNHHAQRNLYFGSHVDVIGNMIVVGVPSDDTNSEDAGAVYAYDANDLSAAPTQLTQYDNITANGIGGTGDWFGSSVAIGGVDADTASVPAPAPAPEPAPAPVIFSQNNGTTDQQFDQVNDYITLTRGGNGLLYNSVLESSHDDNRHNSPAGAAFAIAPSTENYDPTTLSYTTFHQVYEEEIGNNILDSNFNPVVMKCVQSGEFYEITFTDWQQGGGGGFAYTRKKLDYTSSTTVPVYSVTGSESDPISDNWKDYYLPKGYRWIPNVGFIAIEPLTNTSMMFEAVDMTTVDVTNLDMSEVVVASRMFKDAVGMDVTPSDLTGWDVSKVRDFHEMFKNTSFNQAIGGWTFSTDRTTPINDVVPSWTTQDPEVLIAGGGSNWVSPSSTVPSWDGTGINMQGMFEDNVAFNQDIGAWNVSAVFCMDQMFDDAKGFDNGGSPSIGNWDTSYVVDFFAMFRDAEGFSQDIGGWDVSNARQMDSMFRETKSFSHNLNSWNTSNVTKMVSMFAYSYFNGAIGNWDTSSVTNMQEMFEEAYQFDQDIGSWNVSNVTDMNEMFQDAIKFNNGGSPSIGNWDTSSVEDMGEMFENADSFTQDISGWNVSSVTHSVQFDNGVAGNFPSPF